MSIRSVITGGGRAVSRLQSSRWPYLVILLCFAFCLIKFPGEWDNDTRAQHEQMLSGLYRDWHPPVFTAFWRVLNAVWNGLTGLEYSGSGVIYLVHALMIWIGLALIIRAAKGFFTVFIGRERWKLLACLGFLLFFGLFEMVPVTRYVFKDTAMMAAYILAVGLMLNLPARGVQKIAAAFLCLLLLFYGTAVRHNSIFALLPLLFLLGLKVRSGSPGSPGTSVTRRLALIPVCLAVWGALLFGINFVTYDVLKAEKEYSLQEIIFIDFWRLNYETKTYDLPPLPAGDSWAAMTEDVFFRFYNEKHLYVNQGFRFIRQYYGGEDSVRLRFDYASDPEAFGRLKAAWLEKIRSQFGAYVKMHKRIFMELMRSYSFMGFTGAWFLVADLLIVLGGAIALARGRWRGREAAPYLLVLSAILYAGPYVAAIPDIQRRYLFWFFFASFFGLVWLLGQFMVKRIARLECRP